MNKKQLCDKILDLICNSDYDKVKEGDVLDLIYSLLKNETQ